MARDVFTVTIGSVAPSVGRAQEPNTAISTLAAAITAAQALAASTTAVAADVATLVADGASPTQAHVDTLNTDWGTFLTAYTAYEAAVNALSTTVAASSVSADVTLLFNAATVINKNNLRQAVNAVMARALNSASLLSGA